MHGYSVLLGLLLALVLTVEAASKTQAITQFSEGAQTLFTFKISGNYCGPGWCGGNKGDFKKQTCNFNAPTKGNNIIAMT
jgi:hypothetical protein